MSDKPIEVRTPWPSYFLWCIFATLFMIYFALHRIADKLEMIAEALTK